MVAVVERVAGASVTVNGEVIGCIGQGLLVLLGVEKEDTQQDLAYIVRKTAGLRIFSQDGKMTKNVADVDGGLLVVSQFTLLGDARKGTRPDFARAADAQLAQIGRASCRERV